MRKFYSPSQAADAMGVHVSTVTRAAKRGGIPNAQRTPGGHWRIPAAFIAAQKIGANTVQSIANRANATLQEGP